MPTKSISCDLHDYLEIACMYHYQVKLQLKDNQSLEGKAVDVITIDKCEYLVIDADQRREIELTQLVKLQVLTPGAKFKEVRF